MSYKDPEKERACGRRRYERITAERIACGKCPRCGKAKPAPDRTLCRHCGEKRRKAERARCAKAKAAGILYGKSSNLDLPYNPEWLLMPSDVPETVWPRAFPAHSLGIKFDGYFPPSTSIRSSLTPEKVPGRIDGGALASRIFSFSAGVARRYISVVLRSA